MPCHVDGTSDPFIEAFLLPDEYRLGRRRTSARRKTCNPVFNEKLAKCVVQCSAGLDLV